MSTHAAVRQRIAVPPVAELVESFVEKASITLMEIDRHSADAKPTVGVHPVAEPTNTSQPWMPVMQVESTSFSRKGGALAIVALLHVVLFYAIAQGVPQVREKIIAPLQIVTIDTPQAAQDIPPPPVPQQRLPDVYLPEPVIHVAVESQNSITVTPRPVESTAVVVAATGTPKIVSSVEYIREPVAKYPPTARALKQRGTVMLRALIDATGHAAEVNVHRSSGYKLLDETARTAVVNALFRPYTENGQSIPVYVFIPIEFGAAG